MKMFFTLCCTRNSYKNFNNTLYLLRYYKTPVSQICNKNIFPPYLSAADDKVLYTINEYFKVYENFISEGEENEFMKEINPLLKRRRYENDHWDGAIKGYKETEKLEWNEINSKVLQRLRNLAFPETCCQIKYVHVLDLSKEGFIKPHIDSIKFCGDTIAGISLLSTSVMRLAMENDKNTFVDILLPRRSLYVMKGVARYNFTHEILEDCVSFFKGERIKRDRRISVIYRNEAIT